MKRVQSLTLATLVGFVGCYGGDSPDTAISVYDVNRNPTVQEPAASDTEEAAEAESTPAPPAVADPDADRPPSVSPPAPQEVVEATPPVINQPVRVNEEPAPSVPPQEQTTNEEAVGEPATSEPNDDPAATPPATTIADTAPSLSGEQIRLRPETPAEPAIGPIESEAPNSNAELRNLLNELGVESATNESAPASEPAPTAPVEVAETTPPVVEPSESETPAEAAPAVEPAVPTTNIEEINPPAIVDPMPADPPSTNPVPAAPAPAAPTESAPPTVGDQPETAKPALPLDTASELREWIDSTGRLKIKARFVRFDKKIVVVETEDGDELNIPLSRLSSKDQAFLKQIERGDFGI